MNRRLYKSLLLGLALVLIVCAGFLQGALNRQRADPALGLTTLAPLENAPPVLAFTTVALGGFRGLIANALWIRANDLQQEGKYFEMVQLADWITKLEPTFTQVWLVQSWNMTYNISVKFTDPGDRWRWVQRGIELLRDDGLRYNPREALMYRELAWFFQHKMGQNLDDAHMFYKKAWAEEMNAVLGSGRPNFDELINPGSEAATQRARLLRDKYKMDPARMKRVDELYHGLEWRLPEAHAIYWATVGLEEAKRKDLITLRRVVYQSMQVMVVRGRLISIDPLRFGPDLAKMDAANAAYEKMIEDDAEMRDAIKKAHRNFLKEAVFLLFSHNRGTESARWFKYVKEKYPDAIRPGLSLDEYCLDRLTGNIAELSNDKTKALLEGLVIQYYLNLALDEEDRALGLELMARRVRESYTEASRFRPGALQMDTIPEFKERILKEILAPNSGWSAEWIAHLRTKLNLPAPVAPPKP